MRLENLGDLSTKELIDLRDNIENYYREYSSPQQNTIKSLLNLVIKDGFPSLYKLEDVKVDIVDYTLCFKNSYNQICFEQDGKLECQPLFYKVDGKEFRNKFTDARNSYEDYRRWRVDNGYTSDDYQNFDNWVTDDGSTISIHDEDIISVCSMVGGVTRGKNLLKHAVEHGGKKLDAYSGLFRFYVKSGFVPISVCKWDDEYAPDDWVKANEFTDDSWKKLSDDKFNQKREDIVFFIYTGDTEGIPNDYIKWKQTIEYSDDYEDAKIKRDRILSKLGGNT